MSALHRNAIEQTFISELVENPYKKNKLLILKIMVNNKTITIQVHPNVIPQEQKHLLRKDQKIKVSGKIIRGIIHPNRLTFL